MADDQAEPVFDVGRTAQDGTLGLWLAREAVRNAELLLAAQETHFNALDSRLMQALTWSVTGAIASVGVAVQAPYRAAAVAAVCCLMVAALSAAAGLLPGLTEVSGYQPKKILEGNEGSEWATLHAMAMGYQGGIQENNDALARRGLRLKVSLAFLVAAPFVAAAAVILSWGARRFS